MNEYSSVKSTVENARILAEVSMLAQIVSDQYDHCQFEYTDDGYVVMDGNRYSVDDFLKIPGQIMWFFDMVPDQTMIAMNDLYNRRNELDGMDFVQYQFEFMKSMHEVLSKQFGRELDCKTEVWNEDIPF